MIQILNGERIDEKNLTINQRDFLMLKAILIAMCFFVVGCSEEPLASTGGCIVEYHFDHFGNSNGTDSTSITFDDGRKLWWDGYPENINELRLKKGDCVKVSYRGKKIVRIDK